ncbi:glycerophosphoryl diester phosphodiesterase membrane domain-containing protein [Candidatus Pacearchaeota archaeon]|nr:glycerophosphoryl diester phosphodiesterase membrane domain-containing protein [Candidatus Pacearchaeota archaeon]
MNITEDFKLSWESLKNNKVLVLPVFAVPVLAMAVVFLFLYFFGILGAASEYSRLYAEYQQQSKDLFVDQEKLDEYLRANGFQWPDFSQFLNAKSTAIMILSVILLSLIAYYLKCISYGMTALVVKKAKLAWQAAIRLANKFFWKLMVLHLFLALIAFAIVVVFGLGIMMSFFINKWLGILTLIIGIIAMFAVLFFAIIKLFFAVPILFLEDKTAKQSIKQSYSITTGRFKEALIVFAILAGVGIAFGIFGNLFSGSFANLLSSDSAKFVLSFFAALVYYLLSSAVGAFTSLFLFYAYIDFKTPKRKSSKAKAF